MDVTTVAVSFVLGGIAGGAVNAIYRLTVDRHLETHRAMLSRDNAEAIERTKDALQRDREELLTKNKAAIDETVQARLFERKGAIDLEVQQSLEKIRGEIGRDMKSTESRLRLATEVELKLYDRDLDIYRDARRALASANSAAMEAIGHPLAGAELKATLDRLNVSLDTAAGCLMLAPDPTRDPVFKFIGELSLVHATLSGVKFRGEEPPDRRTLFESVMAIRPAAYAALDRWYAEMRSRHSKALATILETSR
jgi:hypothetical protein